MSETKRSTTQAQEGQRASGIRNRVNFLILSRTGGAEFAGPILQPILRRVCPEGGRKAEKDSGNKSEGNGEENG